MKTIPGGLMSLLTLWTSLTACESKKDGMNAASELSSPTDLGFLSAADLAEPVPLAPIPEDEINDKIDGINAFYNVSPNTSGDDNCQMFEQVKVKADKNSVRIDAEEDIPDCLKQPNNITSGKFRMFLYFSCNHDDLSVLNGKAWSEIKDTVCRDADTVLVFSESQFTATMAWTEEDGREVKLNLVSNDAKHGKKGTACWSKPSGAYWTDRDCSYASSLTYSKATVDGEAWEIPAEYFKATGKDLTYDNRDRFYESGVMNFNLNDWEGSMTYTGGMSNPDWQASNGKGSASGKFGKLKLQDDTSLPITRRVAAAISRAVMGENRP